MNNLTQSFRFGLLLFALLISSLGLQAGNGLTATKEWAPSVLTAGNSLVLDDNMWTVPGGGGVSGLPLSQWPFVDRQHRAQLRLSINPDDGLALAVPFKGELELSVTYDGFDGAGVPINPTENFTLSVDYDPAAGLTVQSGSYYVIENAYYLDINIVSVNFEVDGVSQSTVPSNLKLEGFIEAERYWDFDRSVQPLVTTFAVNPTSQTVDIAWNFMQGPNFYPTAEYFELEWTFVEDYTDDPTVFIIDKTQLTYDFGRNATRINLKDQSYQIPLVFEHGYLVFRIRAVGREMPNPEQPQPGDWTVPNVSGTLADLDLLNVGATPYLAITSVHREGMNWIYNATYAEDALKKEVITYHDARMANRQAVTKNNTENQIVVQENVIDALGRPAITVLPTPLPESRLDYQPGMNLNQAGQPYSWQDFDTGDCSTVETPAMSNTAGANLYYSPLNPDKDGPQAYVPDADGYAFNQVEFMDDPTGRPRRQGGVGPEFQLDNPNNTEEHYTSFFYTDPYQAELNDLFGAANVGLAKRYQKNLTLDPNGQVSVSYVDEHGRTIATGLAGAAPAGLDPLASNTGSTMVTRTLTSGGGNKRDGNAWVVNRPHTVTVPGKYFFDYSLSAAQFKEICQIQDPAYPNDPTQTIPAEICFDCAYDFVFQVRDDCGQIVLEDIALIEPSTINTA
ncbi:MAG: hypothetical protein AAFQ87_12025, partial [Bacteroidota bacterium]